MPTPTIAIIGCGNMGTSIIGGLIADGFPASSLWVADPDEAKLAALKQLHPVHVTTDNQAAIAASNTLILAIKPQVLAAVVKEFAPLVQIRKPLVISIAAGVTESSIQAYVGGNIAIVRSMPNTPALIDCGATALYANTLVTGEQRQVAEKILRAVGVITWVSEEKWLDIVTALSGSGPAYFFLVIEALQAGAESLGLPKDIARLLTLQTAYGAARMALESEDSAAVLRQKVTSPGGTTEAALHELETLGIRGIFADALFAAKQRSEELANKF